MELFQELWKRAQRDLIWTVGECAGWIFVSFDEYRIASSGHGGAGQNGREVTIAARRIATTTWTLH
jgi:hypothetical protein